jgi:hypothetical protein
MKLAVDIAGTVISLTNGRLLPVEHDRVANYLETESVHGAWDCVNWLARRLGNNFVLVAGIPHLKVGAHIRVKKWLKHHGMIRPDNADKHARHYDFSEKSLHFLLNNERDETDMCKRLGITHFVANRACALPLSGVKYLYLLNPLPNEELAAKRRCGDQVQIIKRWQDIFDVLGI